MKHSIFSIQCFSALTAIIVSLASLTVLAGDKTGNGGDMCEDRIKVVRDDIKEWIGKGGSSAIDFTPLSVSFTPAQYSSAMLLQFNAAKISCVTDQVEIGGASKTCKNLVDSVGQPEIICNAERLMQTSEAEQYILVHHEFAGLAGIEVSSGSVSSYLISNQLTGFLETTITKRLVIRSSNLISIPPQLTMAVTNSAGEIILADSYGRTLYFFDGMQSSKQCNGEGMNTDLWRSGMISLDEARGLYSDSFRTPIYPNFRNLNCSQNIRHLTYDGKILFTYDLNRKQGDDLGNNISSDLEGSPTARHVILNKPK